MMVLRRGSCISPVRAFSSAISWISLSAISIKALRRSSLFCIFFIPFNLIYRRNIRLYKVFIQISISGFLARRDAVNFWSIQKSASEAAKLEGDGTLRLVPGETEICLVEHQTWWILYQVVPLGMLSLMISSDHGPKATSLTKGLHSCGIGRWKTSSSLSLLFNLLGIAPSPTCL